MKLECKLVEKPFVDKDGTNRTYNALVFELADGSTLDVTIKSDKAKLLKLSTKVSENTMPDNFWSK